MTQTKRILDHLRQGNSITPIEALEKFGCFRLGARIHDIKQMGYEIKTDMIHKGKKHWARYSLIHKEEQVSFL